MYPTNLRDLEFIPSSVVLISDMHCAVLGSYRSCQ